MSAEAEAIARLRDRMKACDPVHVGIVVNYDDLRILLDAHKDALGALALTIDPKAEFASTFFRVEEVLSKAGRR